MLSEAACPVFLGKSRHCGDKMQQYFNDRKNEKMEYWKN